MFHHMDSDDSDRTGRMHTTQAIILILTVLLLWFLTVTCSCCPYPYFGSAIMSVTYFNKF